MSITVWDPDAGSSLQARIAEAAAVLEQARGLLGSRTSPPMYGSTLPYAAGTVQVAVAQVEQAAATLEGVGPSLAMYETTTATVGWWYGWAESSVAEVVEDSAATLAYGLGVAARPLVVGAGLLALGLGWLEQHNPALHQSIMSTAGRVAQGLGMGSGAGLSDVINDPRFAGLVELTIDSMDEFAAGAAGLPPGVLPMLDGSSDAQNRSTLLGLVAAAAGVVRGAGALSVGRQVPSPLFGGQANAVQVASPAVPLTPVTSNEEALQVIADSDSDIVIQQYVLEDGSSHWQVFVQGTESWALDSGDSGLDLGGALQNATNDGSAPLEGSAAAVQQAMLDAGIQPGDDVDLFGSSQGGQAVAQVAAYGGFSVEQVTTFGAPVGDVVMPESVDHLAIETTADVVPSLGGTPSGGTSTVVQVSVPDATLDEIVGDDPAAIAEHDSDVYLWAAGQVDDANDPLLDAYNDDLASDLAGSQAGETTEWEVER